MKKPSPYLYVSFLILGLSIFLLINSVFAWTLPTANPPQGDLPAPLDTSSIEQTKLGNLNLDNNLKVGGLLRIGLYSSHPTGTNGNLYYNTADNKFYGYQNGSWSELGGGGSATYWLASGDNIYNTNTGNVGIGTTNPDEKLEVSGNIKLSGASPTYKITNLATPTASSDAATKDYVDAAANIPYINWSNCETKRGSANQYNPDTYLDCSSGFVIVDTTCNGAEQAYCYYSAPNTYHLHCGSLTGIYGSIKCCQYVVP